MSSSAMKDASKRPWVGLLVLLAASLPRVAAADARTLRVEYTADAACPDARTFVDLAKQRVRVWPEAADRADLVALADVHQDNGVFVGTLSLKDASGASLGTREIREGDCDEVALALALFLAVAVEADAEAARARRPEHRAAPDRDLGAAKVPKPPPREAASWFFVTGAHAVTGRTPNVAPGVSVALEVRAPRGGLLAPFGGLGIDLAPYSTRAEGRGHVDFGWGVAFARMCAAFETSRGHDAAGRWEPWGCARGEVGGLRAASRGYETNRSELLTWFAAGLEAGIAYWMVPTAGLTLTGGASLPLARHAFVLSEAQLFRAPWIAAELGLGIKIRAW